MNRCRCGAPTIRDRCIEGCDDGDAWHLAVLWALLVIGMFVVQPCTRSCTRTLAQDPPLPAPTPAATQDDADISHALMAETDSLPRDNAAELWIWFRAVGGFERLAEQARAYCAIHLARHKTRRMLEILAVPADTSHRDRVEQWNRALESLRLFRAGLLPDPCHGRANHFGPKSGPTYDQHVGVWELLDCGPTAQAYWRRPPP